jgi:hypothetical protein
VTHPDWKQRQQEQQRRWATTSKAFRRWLKDTCEAHGLPQHRLDVLRDYKRNDKVIQVVNTATMAVVVKGSLAMSESIDRERVCRLMVSAHHGLSSEEAAIRIADREREIEESKPAPKPEREPVRDEDWEPKGREWKVAVNLANGQLKSACIRYGLPVHRLRVNARGNSCDIVNAETREPVNERVA